MHISRAGEYGVLGLLHLARLPSGQSVMIDAVSRDENIPKSFLAKIFQDLARGGILRSQRGAGGGFSLARPADQVTVLEVIETIDGRIALQRCLGEEPDCERIEGCVLCGLLEQAQDRLKEVFGQTTLADLAQRQVEGGNVGNGHGPAVRWGGRPPEATTILKEQPNKY
jgi:Rrf2 family protein